jgi:type IV pilus assembly protein PilQ
MKINRSLTEILILVGLFIWIGSASAVQGASSGPIAAKTAKVMEAESGYLENITFEKSKGKERVVLMLSRQSGATTENQGGRLLLVSLENLFVPQELRRVQGEGVLDNLIRVVPAQRTVKGIPQAVVTMELNKLVPYSVRQNGHNIVIDFNVATLPAATLAGDKPAPQQQAALKMAAPEQKSPVQPNPSPPPYAGRLISLDFQDAGIKSVLKLLAEEGGVSIVSGDDVKGNVTVSMERVPWEQALDTILGITGTDKKQQGNVITVMNAERMRKNEKELTDAETARRKGEDDRIKYEEDKAAKEGTKEQISIEAKIIEATDEFVRKLGVQWGAGVTDNLRMNNGPYPYGVLAGANPIGSTSFGALRGLAQGVALTPANLAANFPMAAAAPSYALGFAISSSNAILDAQILASESTSEVRIISSPKVTTMDGEKAVIKQGEDVPVVTPATSTGPATVTFKEAVLKLEVKPTINKKTRKISMVVKANNDFPNYARAAELQGNPPINKSEVDSTVVVNDGETLVIGGILRAQTDKGQAGLPWISKVPILGWLFKYENTSKIRKQLLIFVTPRIIQDGKSTTGTDTKGAVEKPKG